MMNLSELSLGWKVYVLTWAWLGILVGLASESGLAAIVVWAAGATAGWLLLPTVRHRGWKPALHYLAAAAVVFVVIPIGVVTFIGRESQKAPTPQRKAVQVLSLVLCLEDAEQRFQSYLALSYERKDTPQQYMQALRKRDDEKAECRAIFPKLEPERKR